jgi:dihydrolipoamide dehydrogenase
MLNDVPDSLTIVSGGAVGVELASIMNGLGSKVSILEVMPRILSGEDQEVALVFEQALRKSGIKIYADAEIISLETADNSKRIRFKRGASEEVLESESVCLAAGQQPFFDGLGLAKLGMKISSRGIDVDKHMQTTVPGIFAAGDVTGNPMLAYVAMAEGRIAAENASGLDMVIEYSAVPHCVYGNIELASVGTTESQAIKDDLKVKIFRSRLGANASATILGERRGLVKIVAAENGKILGVQMAGTGVSNLIAECALAIKLGAGINDLLQTLHPHPTLSESVWDAAASENG